MVATLRIVPSGSRRLVGPCRTVMGCNQPLLPKTSHAHPLPSFSSSGGRRTGSRVRSAFFSTTGPRRHEARNHVFSPIRNADTLNTHILQSASSRTPLITLWTTSWCPTCKVVGPLLQELVASGVGAAEGGVGLAEVIYDAPDIMAEGLGLTYMINSVPTLLSFDAGEAQLATKVADGRQLADRAFLEAWIRNEARRHGDRGGGSGGGTVFFGGLFGSSK